MSTTEFSAHWSRAYRLGWEDAQNKRDRRTKKGLPHHDFMVAYLADYTDLKTEQEG